MSTTHYAISMLGTIIIFAINYSIYIKTDSLSPTHIGGEPCSETKTRNLCKFQKLFTQRDRNSLQTPGSVNIVKQIKNNLCVVSRREDSNQLSENNYLFIIRAIPRMPRSHILAAIIASNNGLKYKLPNTPEY